MSDEPGKSNFIREIIEEDLAEGKHDEIVTRFPPEPNGYLHIGHAKSIVLNHEISLDYDGTFHLRFDDTNPITEEEEYVESIKEDVAWLGADWGEHLYFASDYYERMYELAERLVKKGKAYVDSLSEEKIREYRGTWNEPGKESPYRDRPVEENLELFRGMRDGEFEEGEHVLRAKIDMSHDNMVMRDPVLYRILYEEHPRTGEEWCIYPMYDYAHCLEDAFEEITHSLCTLEFENNREIYNWVVRETEVEHQPRQIEFARGNIGYTVMSKTRLGRLVDEGFVDSWDDPRMPTLSGQRNRGVPPEAIRSFWRGIGVAKKEQTIERAQYEHAIRDTLEPRAPRVLCVEDPLKVVVENFPEEETDWIEAPYFPENVEGDETRELPFTREIYIERDDFREDPPEGFFRLSPGESVRLRYGYVVTCEEIVRDDDGEIVELRCTHDADTRGGDAGEDRQVEGTIHWVSADHAVDCELRLYDRLFEVEDPTGRDEDFTEFLNDESLVVTRGYIEPSVDDDNPESRYQFERKGYYFKVGHRWGRGESDDFEGPVFNRIVTLRDAWADEETERRKEQARRRAEQKERRKERKKREAELNRKLQVEASGSLAASSRAEEDEGVGDLMPIEIDGESFRFDESDSGIVLKDSADEVVLEASVRDERRFENQRLAQAYTSYVDDRYGLDHDVADMLSGSEQLSEYFEGVLHSYPLEETITQIARTVGAWLVNELVPRFEAEVGSPEFDRLFDEFREELAPEKVADLIAMREEGRITDEAAEEVLDEMLESGRDPETIVDEKGLETITDRETLLELVEGAIEENPDQVEQYAEGNDNLFGFFMGQVMRATDGQADPQLVRELLEEELPDSGN